MKCLNSSKVRKLNSCSLTISNSKFLNFAFSLAAQKLCKCLFRSRISHIPTLAGSKPPKKSANIKLFSSYLGTTDIMPSWELLRSDESFLEGYVVKTLKGELYLEEDVVQCLELL